MEVSVPFSTGPGVSSASGTPHSLQYPMRGYCVNSTTPALREVWSGLKCIESFDRIGCGRAAGQDRIALQEARRSTQATILSFFSCRGLILEGGLLAQWCLRSLHRSYSLVLDRLLDQRSEIAIFGSEQALLEAKIAISLR